VRITREPAGYIAMALAGAVAAAGVLASAAGEPAAALDGVRCITARHCPAVGAEGTVASPVKVLSQAATLWLGSCLRVPAPSRAGYQLWVSLAVS
jgi:hypothetical protein